MSDDTNSEGRFLFPAVRRNNHTLAIVENGRQVYVTDFVVERGATRLNVGQIDVALGLPQSTTQMAADQSNLAETGIGAAADALAWATGGVARAADFRASSAVILPSSCPADDAVPGTASGTLALGSDAVPLASGDYCVRVWLAASPELLPHVEQVIYDLGPSFNPSVVSRYSSEDRFLLAFVSPEPLTVSAQVVFDDGREEGLERQITF